MKNLFHTQKKTKFLLITLGIGFIILGLWSRMFPESLNFGRKDSSLSKYQQESNKDESVKSADDW